MNKKLYLIAASGLLATTLACGDKTSNPAAPSPAATSVAVDSSALADGSTLKVPPPTQVSPANGAQLQDFNIVLKVNPVTATYVNVTAFAYRFQILLNGQVVREFRTSTSTQWTVTDLDNSVSYGWHARAEQGPYFGPWSDTWTFKTPDIPQGYINGGELYDPLYTGTSVGQLRGPVSFVPNLGAKMEDFTSNIAYPLGATVTNGEFSFLLTGLDFNTDGGKTKIMCMQQGQDDITTNDRRFTIEKRGNPAGAVAWRVITSDDQIDTSGPERQIVRFDPSQTYFWKTTWGNGQFNLLIKEGGADGETIYDFGKPYNGAYDPNPHWAYVGCPVGRGGPDDATVPGIVVRQVWLSSRPRPAFANK